MARQGKQSSKPQTESGAHLRFRSQNLTCSSILRASHAAYRLRSLNTERFSCKHIFHWLLRAHRPADALAVSKKMASHMEIQFGPIQFVSERDEAVVHASRQDPTSTIQVPWFMRSRRWVLNTAEFGLGHYSARRQRPHLEPMRCF